jgi:hypothetical protein
MKYAMIAITTPPLPSFATAAGNQADSPGRSGSLALSPTQPRMLAGGPAVKIAGLVRTGLPIDEICLSCVRSAATAECRHRSATWPESTVVPIALLGEPWLRDGKIVMPSRASSRRAVATRAATLGEPVGETIGYRMRPD